MTKHGWLGLLTAAAVAAGALCAAPGRVAAQEGGDGDPPDWSGAGTWSLRTFGVSMRYERFQALDALTSPRRYTGSGFSQNGFHVTLRSDDAGHELEGWIGTLGVAADDGFTFHRWGGATRTSESETELVEATYRHARRVGDGPWWLGAAFNLQVHHTTYAFGAGEAEGFLYFGALGLDGRRELALGQGRRLRVSLEVPLLAWAARPTWSTVDEARLQSSSDFFHRMSTGGLTWPGTMQAVSGRVVYEHLLSDRLALRAGARTGYVRHTDGPVYQALRVGLEMGLTYVWIGGAR